MNAIAEPLEFVDDVYASMLVNDLEEDEAPAGRDGARVLDWTVERICACASTVARALD